MDRLLSLGSVYQNSYGDGGCVGGSNLLVDHGCNDGSGVTGCAVDGLEVYTFASAAPAAVPDETSTVLLLAFGVIASAVASKLL